MTKKADFISKSIACTLLSLSLCLLLIESCRCLDEQQNDRLLLQLPIDPYRQGPGHQTGPSFQSSIPSPTAIPSSSTQPLTPASPRHDSQYTFQISQKLERENSGNCNVGTFSPDGTKLITSDGNFIHVWFEKEREFKRLQTIKLGFYIYNAVWSSNSEMFAVRFFYNIYIFKWNDAQGKYEMQQDIDVDADWFYDRNSIRFSKNDTLLMTAQNTQVLIFQKNIHDEFELMHQIPIAEGKKTRCDISPSGSFILCINNNRTFIFDQINGSYVETMCRPSIASSNRDIIPEGNVMLLQQGAKAAIALAETNYLITIEPAGTHPITLQSAKHNATLEMMGNRRCVVVSYLTSTSYSSQVTSISSTADSNYIITMRDHVMHGYTPVTPRSPSWGMYFTRFKLNPSKKSFAEISQDGEKIIVSWVDEQKKPEIWRREVKATGEEPPQPGSYPKELTRIMFETSVATWSRQQPVGAPNTPPIQFDLVS